VLSLYNTLTNRKEVFKPIKKGKVGLYTCGPTVYDYAHIGNFRAYIVQDLLRRYLEYKGFDVTHIMNITDVDDKTIRNSRRENTPLKEYTERYTRFFFEDLESLNCLKAQKYPRATEHIDDMVKTISVLLDKGHAYRGGDGSVYFDISTFKDYGKLANLDIAGLQAGARLKQDEYDKDSVSDFALWKAWDEEDGDVFWETPLGKGRPGWHIECSVMSTKYLGNPFDIHCGGTDLVFPHHENEIAQTEAATGRPFVNFWVHNEHLLVDNSKMSKSAGNFYTLRQLFEKGFSPAALRYALISVHYRQQLNFTIENTQASDRAVTRLQNFMQDTERTWEDGSAESVDTILEQARTGFEQALDDDLNISKALGILFNTIRDINKRTLSAKGKKQVISFMRSVDSVLGLLDTARRSPEQSDIDPEEIENLIRERDEARRQKDFQAADAIREQLAEKGVILKDGPDGTVWKTM